VCFLRTTRFLGYFGHVRYYFDKSKSIIVSSFFAISNKASKCGSDFFGVSRLEIFFVPFCASLRIRLSKLLADTLGVEDFREIFLGAVLVTAFLAVDFTAVFFVPITDVFAIFFPFGVVFDDVNIKLFVFD